MSVVIFDCHKGGGRRVLLAPWAEARDAATYLQCTGTASQQRIIQPKMSVGAGFEKPCHILVQLAFLWLFNSL